MALTVASARNALRHQLRDGVPVLDATPVPFSMVRLEDLSDQIPAAATPVQTVFQARYEGVPTQQYMPVQTVPGTLVAFVDGAWSPTHPTVDVDTNGNFTLPVAPVSELLITYAWQYLSDGEIDQFVDEARQWLREFADVTTIPDPLVPPLVSYAAAKALRALARTATLANMKAGDSSSDFSALAKSYIDMASGLEKTAQSERDAYYSRGSERLEPFVDSSSFRIDPYQPRR